MALRSCVSGSALEELYDKFFAHMFDGCALHEIVSDETGKSVDYRFLQVNPAFERITGVPAAAIVGKTVREAMPDTEAEWIEAYSHVVKTGVPFQFEKYHEGMQKHFEVVAFRVDSNQFACIFRDITERAKDAELKERLNFMTELLSHVHQAIVRASTVEQLTENLRLVTSGQSSLRLNWSSLPEASDGSTGADCDVSRAAIESSRTAAGNPVESGCPGSGAALVRSCLSAPVRVHGAARATLCVNAGPAGYFNERDQRMLEEAASDVSAALERFDAEARRREAEQRLRHEEEFIRAVAENVTDCVIACNSVGQVAFVNDSARQWLSRHLPSLAPLVAPREFATLLEDVLAGIELRRRPLTIVADCGEVRSLVASGTCFTGPDGAKLGAVLALGDVTDHETTQRLLGESDERWQFALEGADHGVWDANVETGRAHYSRQWKAMLGYGESDIGDSFDDWEKLVHPDDKDVVKAEMNRHLSGEVPLYRAEYRMRCKDGSWRWILGRGRIMSRTPSGQPLRVVGTHTDITEQREAEQRLRAIEARFRLIAENTADVIWLFDTNTKTISYISPSVERVRGLTSEEAMAQTVDQMMTPKSLAFALDTMSARIQALERGDESARVSVDELEHLTKEGSVVPTEVVTTLLTGSDGKVCEIVGVSRDITERKRSEAALRSSQAQLARAMELAHLVPWRLNPATSQFTFNDRFYAMYGTTAEREGGYQMPAATYTSEFVHPEDRAVVERLVAGDPEAFGDVPGEAPEHRIVRRDGEVRHIVARFEVITGESGNVVAVIGVNQDVTERRRAEQSLRASETRFRKLISESPVAICVAVGGRITYSNTAFAHLSGYWSEPELQGRRLLQLVAPECRTDVENWLRLRAYNQDQPANLEFLSLSKDGSRVPVQVAVNWIDLADGPALIAFVEDRRAEKRAEAERERLQAQLLEAHNLESVGRLAGGIAHDFNNLLTVINGYSALTLSQLPKNDASYAAISHIRHAGEKATSLVRQLLAFSRKQRLQPEVLDLNEVVRELSKIVPHLLDGTVEVVLDIGGPVKPVLADRQQIEQAVMTLVVNARDAMPEGGRLEIETSNIEREQDGVPVSFVRLTVRDNGTGIDDQTKTHIFEPFFTTKPVGQGTGLGLASVHGIVTQSGGLIELETQVGLGTAFHIYLPAVRQAVGAGSSGNDRDSLRGTETILLVEDQDDVRRFVATVLERRGYTVLPASNGREALEICEARKIQLLISDVVMPKMSGFELAREAELLQPGLKILFMSGYASDAPVTGPDLTRGAPLMNKPFTAEALAAKVREVLGVPKSRPRVLVVDDDDDVRGYLCRIFSEAGYETRQASDGRRALREIESSPVDLIVTDLVMPEMEGLATIRAVRRKYPALGIIAISGANGGQYLRMARPLGADAALRKPVEPDELLKEARRVLGLTL